MSGVLELSSIFYFVVCQHSGQGVAQVIIRSAIDFKGTHGLRFWTMQRTL
ncbi:hypothetical protein Gogos_009930 [Gossypium gossypioides]|uniref:Uncharacterized protein n=1 Tax=Gossypium gossypioides TaxID=34282 RepID=A0A7J9BJJ8_GOSGO|nr:hypothetical protein [Gossypium gossypioides]